MEEGRQYRMNPKVFQAASTGDSSYFESLIYPSRTSSLVKFLIDHAKKLNVEAGGHRQLLRMVNILGKDTALHIAVRYGKFEIVKMLIKEDPELAKYVNKAGESALFLAVDKQRYDIAFYILSAASDCSYAGRHGMNVLHAIAIHTSSCKCCPILLFKYCRNMWTQSLLDYDKK
uniref:Ankyrin repeat-containing protein n=1 Tax=Quercus lobata TaxID=97700 RepID=A0A7N2L529_QUELO